MSNNQNMLTKKERAQLRAALLWIWFIKNIKVFVWALFIVLVALTCMGVIDGNTPFLGTVFGSISEAFTGLIKDLDGDYTIWKVVEAIISLGFIVGLAATNLDRIALKDIKSKRIKILLVKAGLYFDKNGKLTKRVEIITNTDIDGDGKVDTEPEVVDEDETLVEQFKRSGEELKTIINIDLSEIDKDGNIVSSNTETTTEEVKVEAENEKEVKRNLFIIVWRKIVKFFKKVFTNVKIMNELDNADKDKVNAAVLESLETVAQEEYEKAVTEAIDKISSVQEVETETATLTEKTEEPTIVAQPVTEPVKAQEQIRVDVGGNAQDALASILGNRR